MAKVVTIKDVAKVAGVSPMTVSRVLNDRPDVSPRTRKRIQLVIEELGYAPSEVARSLSQGRSNTLGVVSSGLDLYGPSRTLAGIEQEANRLGFSLMVKLLHNPLESRGEDALLDLVANHVAGIVWAVAEIGDGRNWLYDQLDTVPMPVVFMSMAPRSDTSVVSVDNRLGARLATRHLLGQGYQKIGLINGPAEWWEAREREAGWQEVLELAGSEDLDQYKEWGDWTAESGHRAMKRLLDRLPELDAVFVANDSMALGALQAAAGYGRTVPHDLAVVGYDDIPEAAYFSPPLTTIRQGLFEVGQQSVNLLFQALQARRNEAYLAAKTAIIEPRLIVRQSSMREA